MFNCKMIINRLHIEDARMEIGVAINCPFDVDVSSPKARILFECDGQTRRWTRSFTASSRKVR